MQCNNPVFPVHLLNGKNHINSGQTGKCGLFLYRCVSEWNKIPVTFVPGLSVLSSSPDVGNS